MSHDTFDSFPAQLEWALVALLAYTVYILPGLSSSAWFMGLLSGFIILNGWISSRAGAAYYSDILIILDVIILAIYYFMLRSLQTSQNVTATSFWIYSGVLAIVYLFWDLAILRVVTDPNKRKRYFFYVKLLLVITALHFFLGYANWSGLLNDLLIAAVGGASWVIILLLWHYDKWKTMHSNPNTT